jgi:glutamate dehydrogenase
MKPYFFDAMRDEPGALAILSRELGTLRENGQLVLADRPSCLIVAVRNTPGSLYRALTQRTSLQRAISYAMVHHSMEPIPGLKETLEIQRFDFDVKTDAQVAEALKVGADVPPEIRKEVSAAMKKDYRDFDMKELDEQLSVLWVNNPSYVRVSSARRVAQTMRLLQFCQRANGLFLDTEAGTDGSIHTRVSLAVASAPQHGFLAQVIEAFNRLDLGVDRAYVLEASDGTQPYALATFHVNPRKGPRLLVGSPLHHQLERELFNTQILAASSFEYREQVMSGLMSGEDASLVRAFVAFCHTNLAHARPDRFDWDEVRSAFRSNPQLSMRMVSLFRERFAPGANQNEKAWSKSYAEIEQAVSNYNTGHKHLDDLRREIFRCCLLFIRHTLKTNYFVRDKQAFSFRLDPAYLAELGPESISDLPAATPFRVTFFYTRYGFGFHIGFSDIARGGWRTVICRTHDDFETNAATIFRENFVLAHTQHLKNKDIYEGGSKLVMLMDSATGEEPSRLRELETLRLHKLQRAVINAFLDIYVTEKGVAKDPNVVDYYREDEAIELGPDENMHDNMIEEIAALSKKRGYILGIGLMSSKRVGINHKEFAVTSTGVVKYAEITMKELGIDMRKQPFTVKFTGGPNGDVAGNAMAIILKRCPQAKVVLILDGTAALHDPDGADHTELKRILLKEDLHAFDPKALHVGGSIIFRTGTKKDGLRETYRRVTRTSRGMSEEWISVDEFSRQFGSLPFTVPADLFIPGGGRPETIDKDNWQRFLLADGTPSARAIIEGANSFITPPARVELQKKGVIVMRDASANKCGVISSSYEIIANLLLTEEEFLKGKKSYVAGVLEILEKRAADEANLILQRHKETGRLYTEISDQISKDINANYERLFRFFQSRPELCSQEPFAKALRAHLPKALRVRPDLKKRIKSMPPKYVSAILAAEIGSSMVYRGNVDADFEDIMRLHLKRHFEA